MENERRMNIVADSGFFYAFFDPREARNHRIARDSFDTHINPSRNANKLLLLWPVLHEMINTRFVKRYIEKFERLLKVLESKNLIEYVDDADYRDDCLSDTLSLGNNYRNLSLVDRVIRRVLRDSELRIDAIITFDPGDFNDICKKREIRLLCQEE